MCSLQLRAVRLECPPTMGHCLCYYLVFSLLTFAAVSLSAADLHSDLREFVALVPHRRIAHIAARYYIFDGQFRQSLQFVRSQQLGRAWQQMRATPELNAIVQYMAGQGVRYDVTNIVTNVLKRLQAYQLRQRTEVALDTGMVVERNLTSFLHEVLQSLPRANIAKLMARKVQENSEFAQLYRALRRTEFRQLIMSARHSSNLQSPLSILQRNFINVDELLQVMFELIAWGPQV